MLKQYELEHPGFVLPTVKTLITKNDRHILEKLVRFMKYRFSTSTASNGFTNLDIILLSAFRENRKNRQSMHIRYSAY